MPFLENQTAVVSGAAQGLGAAYAEALAQNGANVVLFDVQPSVTQIAETIASKTGQKTLALVKDVSKRLDVEDVVKQALDTFGAIDILINNAGAWRETLVDASWEQTLEDWDFIMDPNLKGVMMLSRLCAPHMKAKGGGNIVNISTYYVLPARSPGTNQPTTDLYNASKWALNGFTQAWATYLKPDNIRVNGMCMGATDTPMLRGLFPDKKLPPQMAETVMKAEDIAGQLIDLLKEGPLGRTGENIGAWVGYPIELGPRPPAHRTISG
jgi:NAD(P)-dependent dehydrogenase (short-subunit alcohol dehydrogenase family)